MWWFYGGPVFLFVLFYGRTVEPRPKEYLISRPVLANIATIILVLNSLTTYVGLKSNADLGMFSNMRTEWGESNHYIIQKPLYLFPYLKKENYIQVKETIHPDLMPYRVSEGDKNKNLWIHKLEAQKLFYYNKSNDYPYWISYINSNGKLEQYDGRDERHLFHQKPNWFVRNYLVFTEFVNETPRPCSPR